MSGSRLSIELNTVNEDDKAVYLAGNFNNWTIADPNYRMDKIADGKFRFNFPDGAILPETIEYKYLRR